MMKSITSIAVLCATLWAVASQLQVTSARMFESNNNKDKLTAGGTVETAAAAGLKEDAASRFLAGDDGAVKSCSPGPTPEPTSESTSEPLVADPCSVQLNVTCENRDPGANSTSCDEIPTVQCEGLDTCDFNVTFVYKAEGIIPSDAAISLEGRIDPNGAFNYTDDVESDALVAGDPFQFETTVTIDLSVRRLYSTVTLMKVISGGNLICGDANFFAFVAGRPTPIVVPSGLENIEGIGADFSFWLEAYMETELRQQNFYRSDQFSALSGPKLITEIALRITNTATPGQILAQTAMFDAEFRLSTTSKDIQELSTTFSENYGDDNATTVFRDETWILMTNGDEPNSDPSEAYLPNPFDIIIPLQTPYLYDPSKGNLNFEYIIRTVEQVVPPDSIGPAIDNTGLAEPGDYLFGKMRILYSFDVGEPTGLLEYGAPVARFTFEDPPVENPPASGLRG